ncbi:MAG: efflux RND transporter periplasmic adaptor subunit, partial [Dysgonamonadaceae bacterium]|nr:efflux RND transporter periplasmic adaptor subunit [Dysgonamonadaceae bacterium]
MDREISLSVKRKRIRKKLLLSGIIGLSIMIFVITISQFMKDSISLRAVDIGEVDRGSIEITIAASGKWSPLMEE